MPKKCYNDRCNKAKRHGKNAENDINNAENGTTVENGTNAKQTGS